MNRFDADAARAPEGLTWADCPAHIADQRVTLTPAALVAEMEAEDAAAGYPTSSERRRREPPGGLRHRLRAVIVAAPRDAADAAARLEDLVREAADAHGQLGEDDDRLVRDCVTVTGLACSYGNLFDADMYGWGLPRDVAWRPEIATVGELLERWQLDGPALPRPDRAAAVGERHGDR